MSKGAKAKVAEYRLSTHFGICHAPVRLRKMWFGEKVAFEDDITEPAVIGVNKPELFGGVTKEGGVQGNVYWLPGKADQVMPEELATKFGLTSETMPGFRGFASVFMTSDGTLIQPPPVGGTTFLQVLLAGAGRGTQAYSLAGFVWSYNSPYLKPFWATVTGDAQVVGLVDDFAMIGDDANPVHIIWDSLTNTDWGMSAPITALNQSVWQEAAQTLFDEEFGLSLGWFQQATVEDFISDILSHIQATVFVNPSNGLFEIKLLRDDYDRDTLPVFDESNSKLSEFQRRLWGETVNEIVVSWTNPENEETETVSDQDLGNVIAQGAVVSDSREYKGVRNRDLAAKLAKRDVRTAAAPLATCTLECNRDAANLVPGGVIKISNQKHGLNQVVFRITEIDYGKTNEARIRLSLIEDIFGYRVGAYFTPVGSLHVSGLPPEPAPYTKTLTMPAFLAAQYGGSMPEDPDVFAGIMSTAQPGSDTTRFELLNEVITIGGSTALQSLGTRGLNGRSVLQEDLPAESQSLIEFADLTLGVAPEIEGFVLIGGADEVQELAFLSDIDSNNVWTLERGMLDTVPRAWPAGTEIWFISVNASFGDSTARVDGEEVTYKVLPQTSQGTLDRNEAAEVIFTLNNRTQLPIRPAKVRINGEGFGAIDLTPTVEADGDLIVTWANRNRDLEETTVFLWDGDGLTPPVGQTTIVRIFDSADALIAEYPGLAGESYTLDPYDYLGKNLIRINVRAELAGDESLQGFDLHVQVGVGGWGLNWGYDFGGS